MHSSISTSRPNNLPVFVSQFIGREREILQVIELLKSHRLLTLSGPGGCGKTRLAIEAAGRTVEEFPDGVWLVEFAQLDDETLVTQTIASTLGASGKKNRTTIEEVMDHLQNPHSLLLFDNCEHLVKTCAELTEKLLVACPNLRILTTSREPLNIPGEKVWFVPPMSLPELQTRQNPINRGSTLSVFQKSEAIQLFLNRARLVSPDFELSVQNGNQVAEICLRLDGIPLAIELAAARVRALSVQQIAVHLDDRFNLLTSGSRTAPLRQQTLEATIDWSYALLSEKERKVLQAFSVFSGGGILEAVEYVCAGSRVAANEVLNTVSQLVDKSLVITSQRSGKTRYSLLESIREYSLEKLEHSQEWEAFQNRHLDFFLKLVEEAELKLKGPENLAWYARLEAEHDNLRAAHRWALESQNTDAGLRLASALSFFRFVRGYSEESIIWLEKSLQQKGSAPASSIAKARKKLGVLLLSNEKRNFDRIDRLLEESLDLYQQLDDEEATADVLNYMGISALEQRDYKKAKQFLIKSLNLRRAGGDPWNIAHTLQNLVSLSVLEGDLDRAKAFSEETITLFQQAGDMRGAARTLIDLADIAYLEGNVSHTKTLLARSLIQLVKLGDKSSTASGLETFAALETKQGNVKRATVLLGAVQAIRESISVSAFANPEHKNYDENLTTVQDNLSEMELTQLWDRGHSMSLEQIVEFALQKSEESIQVQTEKERLGGLTARECEVAVHVAQGKSNREIAEAMTVRVKTVETYITRILHKLGFNSRVQIATWAVDKGLK